MSTTMHTCTHQLGAQLPPYWHRPFLRYLDGDQGGATADDTGQGDQGADAGSTGDQGDDEHVDGADALGDAGKRALDAMKADRNAARQRARDAEAERDALKAQIAGTQQQHEQQVTAQRAADDRANLRIKKAELRGAAAGKLADPEDAIAFVDLGQIEIDDEGNIDRDALTAAVDDLLRRKPHLAVAQGDGRRFQGGGDGGARNGGPGPRQLTEADLEKMTPEQVNAARLGGQLDKLLGVPQR